MHLPDTATIEAVGSVATAIGVIVAIFAIIWTSRLARKQIEDEHLLAERQKDLEALLQLSNHLTAWHDDLLDVLKQHDSEVLERFQRRKKYEGPLIITLALLGGGLRPSASNITENNDILENSEPKRREYQEVYRKVKDFRKEALNTKKLEAELLDRHIRIDLPNDDLTISYTTAMNAIREKAQRL